MQYDVRKKDKSQNILITVLYNIENPYSVVINTIKRLIYVRYE